MPNLRYGNTVQFRDQVFISYYIKYFARKHMVYHGDQSVVISHMFGTRTYSHKFLWYIIINTLSYKAHTFIQRCHIFFSSLNCDVRIDVHLVSNHQTSRNYLYTNRNFSENSTHYLFSMQHSEIFFG